MPGSHRRELEQRGAIAKDACWSARIGGTIAVIGPLEVFVEAPVLDAALDVQTDRLASELESRYSRAQIQQIVEQCAAKYRDAQITTFVPILVYRDARSLLSDEHVGVQQSTDASESS